MDDNLIVFVTKLLLPPGFDPSVPVTSSAVFNQFEPVTLCFLHEIVCLLNPSGSLNNATPPRRLKEVFPTVGPSVLTVINSSLASGIVPRNFKCGS